MVAVFLADSLSQCVLYLYLGLYLVLEPGFLLIGLVARVARR